MCRRKKKQRTYKPDLLTAVLVLIGITFLAFSIVYCVSDPGRGWIQEKVLKIEQPYYLQEENQSLKTENESLKSEVDRLNGVISDYEQIVSGVHKVNFYLDSSVIDTQMITDGECVLETPSGTEFKEITGWTLIDGTEVNPLTHPITQGTNFYAIYTQYYTATFINGNEIVGKLKVPENTPFSVDSIKKPSATSDLKTCVGWGLRNSPHVIDFTTFTISEDTMFVAVFKDIEEVLYVGIAYSNGQSSALNGGYDLFCTDNPMISNSSESHKWLKYSEFKHNIVLRYACQGDLTNQKIFIKVLGYSTITELENDDFSLGLHLSEEITRNFTSYNDGLAYFEMEPFVVELTTGEYNEELDITTFSGEFTLYDILVNVGTSDDVDGDLVFDSGYSLSALVYEYYIG